MAVGEIKVQVQFGEVSTLAEIEKDAILRTLMIADGNKTRAAKLLGISIRTMRNKLKLYESQKIELRFVDLHTQNGNGK